VTEQAWQRYAERQDCINALSARLAELVTISETAHAEMRQLSAELEPLLAEQRRDGHLIDKIAGA
jgi:hypothetical protein